MMKLLCMFITLMSYIQLQMAGPAYPPSPSYNSGGYLQGQAYASTNSARGLYNSPNTAHGGQAYYANNAPYNSGQAYSSRGAYNGQAYAAGATAPSYNTAQTGGQGYSSGSAAGSGRYSGSGTSLEGQLLDIMIPQVLLEDFEYVPTKEGYRFSYTLADGTKREEVGLITNPGGDNQGLVVMGAMTQSDPNDPNSSTTTMFTNDDKNGFRPRGMLKSRKLSPKSLQSLAG